MAASAEDVNPVVYGSVTADQSPEDKTAPATTQATDGGGGSQFPAVVVHSDQAPIISAENAPPPMPAMTFSFQRRLGRRSSPSRLEVARLRLLSLGPSWCSHPDIQKHTKLILLSSFFCSFGIILLLAGISILSVPPHHDYGIVFIIGGGIVFIPGIYHLVYVLRAYLGHEGYSFQDLPLMD